MIKGIGRDANPIDGDRIVIEVEIRDGKVFTLAPQGLIDRRMRWVGGVGRLVEFNMAIEARELGGETFQGCDSARRAARALWTIVGGRSIEEALALGVGDVIAAMGGLPAESERCVLTVLRALRSALIDAQVAALAEATIEIKALKVR